MKAMIFAAGLGTRLRPYTNNKPKALAEVKGKTLLQRNIEYLKGFGIKEFVINIHHFPDLIRTYLSENRNFDVDIQISDETDMLLETGGGLQKAAPLLSGNEPFLVMNVDILTNLNIRKLIDFHTSGKALATLAVTNRSTSRYFLFNENEELCGWKNVNTGEEKIRKITPPLREMAFSGIHIIQPEIFFLMKQEGKFSIVDTYLDLCSNNIIRGFDHSQDVLIDVGKPEAIVEAEQFVVKILGE
ncbi:MAG: NDP-sugar synthase [Cytophagaceae bacterium]